MILESYPQMILNVFIIQSLQIDEWLNIGSCVISALSVILGFSDFLVTYTHEHINVSDIPFTKKVFGIFSITIDTFLRALSIAYLMTFMKAYILLLPLFYFVLMLIIVCIKRKISKWKHFWSSAEYTTLSFGCSAWEGRRNETGGDWRLKQKFKLRPISKTVFTIVLIGFLVYFRETTAPGLLSNDLTNTELTFDNSIFNTLTCKNLCPNSANDDDNSLFSLLFFDRPLKYYMNQNQTEIEVYCSGLQYHISPNIHIGMWIAIGVLFCLSWLELALESCCDWMPYHKIFEPILVENNQNEPDSEALDSLNQIEEGNSKAEEMQPLAQEPQIIFGGEAESEQKARLEAEGKSLREEKARLEAEVKALAEAKAMAEAEKKARLEFEVKALAKEKTKLEAKAEAKAKSEAEVKSLAEKKARLEAEVKALAEEKARLEAKAKAKAKAKEKTKLEEEAAAAKARIKAEERTRLEAEEKTRLEAEPETKARLEA